jgi:hypothetical protein
MLRTVDTLSAIILAELHEIRPFADADVASSMRRTRSGGARLGFRDHPQQLPFIRA